MSRLVSSMNKDEVAGLTPAIKQSKDAQIEVDDNLLSAYRRGDDEAYQQIHDGLPWQLRAV